MNVKTSHDAGHNHDHHTPCAVCIPGNGIVASRHQHTLLQEPGLLRNAVGFYRLMAAWLLRLAYPPLAQGQMPFVPLPEPAPAQFRALPVRHQTLCA